MKITLNSILVLKNNALLEHTMPIHLCTDYGCFCPIVAELSSCQRDHMAHEAKNIYYLTL